MRHPIRTLLAAGTAVALIGATPATPVYRAASPEGSLRDLATARHLDLGVAVSKDIADPQYAVKAAGQFNMAVPENAFKWNYIHPRQGTYQFALADGLVDWAEANDMSVRGAPLLWHNSNPGWLKNGNWTRDSLIREMRDHIFTVVGRYKGRVKQWDVVNEALAGSGAIRWKDNIWYQVIGPDYIALAFEFAHQADPDAKLYYNDFHVAAVNPKSDAMYDLVKHLKGQGVPIDGVGFQMHAWNHSKWIAARGDRSITANLRRFEGLGLDVAFTEMDVRIDHPDPSTTPPTNEQLQTQAQVYGHLLRVCLREPRCKTVVLWGLTDRYSWVPSVHKGMGWANIYNKIYQPKPAYDALKSSLAS